MVVFDAADRSRFDERGQQHRSHPAAAGTGDPRERGGGPRRLAAAGFRFRVAGLVEGNLEQPVSLERFRGRDLGDPGFEEGVDVGERRGAARLVGAREVVTVVAEVGRDEREFRRFRLR